MTAIDWKQRLQAHQLLRGNGYCEIRTDFRGRSARARAAGSPTTCASR
jgi:phage portal protein BeeE